MGSVAGPVRTSLGVSPVTVMQANATVDAGLLQIMELVHAVRHAAMHDPGRLANIPGLRLVYVVRGR